MKTLILMRHAKAAPPHAQVDDIDRHLAARGERDAAALGAWIRSDLVAPDIALVSGAQRTCETWALTGLASTVPVRVLPELYDAVPSGYLGLVAGLDCDVALIIGHNPTVAQVAHHLLRDTELPLDLSGFPTGTTLEIRWDTDDWDTAVRTPGTLGHWTIPAMLDR